MDKAENLERGTYEWRRERGLFLFSLMVLCITVMVFCCRTIVKGEASG